ncbi:MAG: flagellin FliC3 [Lachnospiraceae bacterium]|nr:flagellin FliC3 [Lachnospiraceae bacterium]MBD5481893.1 flagellin FliC3 [Lachnospiraceae bacterium]
MKINYNLQAMGAQRALKRNEAKLSASTQRLSSGYKINQAKDNPAGMAISKKMRLQIRGLTQAGDNIVNGISVCETADGTLAEVHDMLQRMKELAVKASNGTNTTSDRTSIECEVKLLKEEITRIATQTDFNDMTLIDGTFDLRGYADTLGVSVTEYSDEVPLGKYTIQIDAFADDTADPPTDAQVTLGDVDAQAGSKQFWETDAKVIADGNKITITDNKGKTISLELDEKLYDSTGNPLPRTVSIDLMGIGGYAVQVGVNEGQLLDMRLPTVSLKTLGIEDMDVTTEKTAKEAMTTLSEAIDKVSLIRARIGAYQNRLEHAGASVDATTENMTAAVSRITDLDMSEEMVDYTIMQVLVQAGTSMLSQANSQPEQALQLLQ